MNVPNVAADRNILPPSSAVEDVWNSAEIHHLAQVPFEAKLHLYSTLRPSQHEPDLVRLAFVRFGRHSFDLDPSGTLSIVAPIVDEGQLVNLAAFACDEDGPRKLFHPGYLGVGLEDGLLDARLHAQSRLLVFFSVQEWLRNGCIGFLPVDWRATAIFILQENISLLATSEHEGTRVLGALETATSFNEMFIRKVATS